MSNSNTRQTSLSNLKFCKYSDAQQKRQTSSQYKLLKSGNRTTGLKSLLHKKPWQQCLTRTRELHIEWLNKHLNCPTRRLCTWHANITRVIPGWRFFVLSWCRIMSGVSATCIYDPLAFSKSLWYWTYTQWKQRHVSNDNIRQQWKLMHVCL